MARLSFRQGVVRHQTDTVNTPTFLQQAGSYINLIVSPDPTIITFAHGTTDYLYTEHVTVNQAWGPFTSGQDYWLYWDLNKVSGIRTFGFTTLEPIISPTAPPTPTIDQYWFDTNSKKSFAWNGTSWVEAIRVFACKYQNGTQIKSVSINAPKFIGTQVGLTTNIRAGSLVFDNSGNPIKSPDNKRFFTTEDAVVTGVPTGASLRINNIILQAEAQQPMAAYTIVAYSDFNKVLPASVTDRESGSVLGIIEEDATTNEAINFIVEGVVFNEDWDWVAQGASINDPIYNNNSGEIVRNPAIPGQLPIGTIIGRREVLFAPGLFPQLTLDVGNIDHGDLTGIGDDDHPQYHTDSRGDARYYQQSQVDTLLANKSNVGHQHAIADVLNLQTELDGKVDLTGDTMTGNLIMSSGTDVTLPDLPVASTDATNKQYVDQVAAGVKARAAVDAFADTDLTTLVGQTVTYDNGSVGVGATLTNAPNNGALPTVDDVTIEVDDRIVVGGQTNDFENGVYELTQQGDGSTPFILTRVVDVDDASEIPSSFVIVQQGTSYENTGWVASVDDVGSFTVGVDGIIWIQFIGVSVVDELVAVSGNDTTPGTLSDKITATTDISISQVNDGGDEDLQIGVNTGNETGDIPRYEVLQDLGGGFELFGLRFSISSSPALDISAFDDGAGNKILGFTNTSQNDGIYINENSGSSNTIDIFTDDINLTANNTIDLAAPIITLGNATYTNSPTNSLTGLFLLGTPLNDSAGTNIINDLTTTINFSYRITRKRIGDDVTLSSVTFDQNGAEYILIIEQINVPGEWEITWPGTITWINGQAPSVAGPIGHVVAIKFIVNNDGSVIYGSYVYTSGTTNGDILQLEDVGGTPGLPAVDGSQLTGVVSEQPKLHLIQVVTSNGQVVINFGQTIVDDLSGQGNVKNHHIYRNGVLQTNTVHDSELSPVTGDYTITNAGAGEVTFAIGLSEDDVIIYETATRYTP